MEPQLETPCPVRYLVTCPCGLTRCLPPFIKEGDPFALVACPKCGSTMVGTFIGDHVEVK